MVPEELCPYWVGANEAAVVAESVRWQLHEDVVTGTWMSFLRSFARGDRQESEVTVCGTCLSELPSMPCVRVLPVVQ